MDFEIHACCCVYQIYFIFLLLYKYPEVELLGHRVEVMLYLIKKIFFNC